MELRLPSEYQEVEYIENTGTQYIITDLLFPKELENPKIEWGFMQIAVPSGDNMIFGYWSSGSIYYEVYNSTTLSYASIGKNHYDRISNSNLTKDMFIAGVMTKETMYLNEYSYATNAEDTIDQSVRPMAIFAWNSSSGRTYTNKGARIYYLRFYDGNTKMADYVPCYRKSDGEIGMYDTVTKTFYTNAGTDTFLKGADITRYIDNVSVLDTRRKILLNTPYIDTSVGDLVTFNTDLSAPLKSCKVSFLPVQEGEGDPSPDNVRNITGWNGVEVNRCGKNLVPWIKTNLNVQGDRYNGFANWSKLWEIPKRISYTYSVFIDNSNCSTAGSARVWLRDIDNSKYTHVVAGKKINAGEKGFSIVTLDFSNLPNDYYAYWGLDLYPNAIASMPIVYESDQETVIISDWSSDIGIVYGGYVDLISGKLVQEFKQCKINEFSWSYFSNEACFATSKNTPNDILKDKSLSISYIRSDYYTPIDGYRTMSTYTDKQDYSISLYVPSDQHRIVIKDSRFTDVSSFLSAMGDTYIWYRLAEPITYQLTPQQLTTLHSINNIWSSANGEVEIKYWKH